MIDWLIDKETIILEGEKTYFQFLLGFKSGGIWGYKNHLGRL